MQPDYTDYLKAIASALNRQVPWWQHPWILAGTAASLGVIGGFVGQILLMRYTSTIKLKALRRMTYTDIGELFMAIHSVLNFPYEGVPDEVGQEKRRQWFRLVAPHVCEHYVKANPETLARLPEQLVLGGILKMHHHLLTGPDQFDRYLKSTIQMISLHFRDGHLKIAVVQEYMGSEAATTLESLLSRYYPDIDTRRACFCV